jgi:hypothetical protein
MPKLSELSTEEMSDRCGACHRTWAQVQTSNIRGLANVRFQPYRLTNSRCYDAADPRIRCAACHDVHAELARAPKSYDGKCLACHTSTQNTKVKVCHTANSDCTTCHMPKFELPGSHYKFTDHQIRIVKANETYPN